MFLERTHTWICLKETSIRAGVQWREAEATLARRRKDILEPEGGENSYAVFAPPEDEGAVDDTTHRTG